MNNDSYMEVVMKKINMPSEEVLEEMENMLNVASDYTRLKIMYSLLGGEKCVSEIMNEIDASQSLVSHQLKVLKDAHLVSFKKEGTKVIYYLDDYHVKDLLNVVYDHVSEDK